MPKEVTNDLLYEILKSIQAQVSVLREDTEMLKTRASSHERRLGEVHSAIGELHSAMGGQNERLDRMEFQIRQIQSRMDTFEAFSGGDSVQ